MCYARALVENVVGSNSADDHFLYVPSSTNCSFRNIHGSGTFRGEAIAVGGTSDDNDCHGNLIENVTLRDLDHNGPTDQDGSTALSIRPSSNGIVERNTYRNVDIEAPSADYNTNISIGGETTLENINWHGEQTSDNIVQLQTGAAGTTIDGLDIEISGGASDTTINAINVSGATDVTIRDYDVSQEDAPTIPVRGLRISGGDDGVENIFVSDTSLGVEEDQHLQIVDGPGPVRQVGFSNLTFEGELNTWIDGVITFASGTMFPQDVTEINNPYEGYVAYNDGSTGTAGPCVYDGSAWQVYDTTAL